MEIAFVWAFPVEDRAEINDLEAVLFHHFDPQSQLMNGALPKKPAKLADVPKPFQIVQVMSDEEIADRMEPEQRLPRQASHYAQIVGHFVAVKSSSQVARAMNAHFERLKRYHQLLLGKAEDMPDDREG